jgi:hypothetical protein
MFELFAGRAISPTSVIGAALRLMALLSPSHVRVLPRRIMIVHVLAQKCRSLCNHHR